MTSQIILADTVSSRLPNTTYFPSPRNFYALGDSYSAGIGANCGWIKDEFDAKGECLKCDGAYPYQIIEIANASDCMEVYHVGCTGASMPDILEVGWNNRTSQLDLLASAPEPGGWGTLSVGGNDVGFANIVSNCIMWETSECNEDMNLTQALIADPLLVNEFATTYLAILGAATSPDFKLIVTSYAQFFNSRTELCNKKFFWVRGRYLTREFRAHVNQLVAELNLVIEMAVAIVQMQLIFANSQKSIFFEDWDALFTGHRFCEEAPQAWDESWFFLMNGDDKLPNRTVLSSETVPPHGEEMVDIRSIPPTCDSNALANSTEKTLCKWAQSLADGRETNDNVFTLVWPWRITKSMHPKSIAHHELAKTIYRRFIDGDYF